MSTAAGTAKATKEQRARLRACFDNELVHVRLGNWRERDNAEVTLIGLASELHGAVCTCCPRRATAGVA